MENWTLSFENGCWIHRFVLISWNHVMRAACEVLVAFALSLLSGWALNIIDLNIIFPILSQVWLLLLLYLFWLSKAIAETFLAYLWIRSRTAAWAAYRLGGANQDSKSHLPSRDSWSARFRISLSGFRHLFFDQVQFSFRPLSFAALESTTTAAASDYLREPCATTTCLTLFREVF